MTGLARPVLVLYNKTHAWRPTDKRSEGKARGRAPGQPPVARAGGAGPARRHRDLGGASQGRGRLGIRAPVPTLAAIRAPGTAATPDERKTFDQVFAAIGLTPRQRKGRQR